MKKVTLNTATDKTKRLIELLTELESNDYSRISDNGKRNMDQIWKLLGMPTNAELKMNSEKKEELGIEHFKKSISDKDEEE